MASKHTSNGVGPGSGADAVSLATELARAASEKMGEEITILDLRGKSTVTDIFVLVTCRNYRQQSAITKAIDERAAELGCRRYGAEGVGEGRWTLLDYVDVVVHIFDKEWRKLYDLELLWGDAPRIEWDPDGQGPRD